MPTNDSYIETTNGSTAFVGPDATRLFAVMSLRAAIRLYVHTGMKANSAYTPKMMAYAATKITGQPYARGKVGLRAAMADLTQWIEAMNAALPVVDGNHVSLANMNPAAMAAAARNAKKEG